jgi:hypothetical protein
VVLVISQHRSDRGDAGNSPLSNGKFSAKQDVPCFIRMLNCHSISYHSSNSQARAAQLVTELLVPTILPEPETSIDALRGGWIGSKGLT